MMSRREGQSNTDDRRETFVTFECNSLGYGRERSVIEIPSLAIKHGDRIAVIGGSGSGKTTFANSILGREVRVDGKFTRPKLLPGAVGFVGQAQSLFPWRTVLEHVNWVAEAVLSEGQHGAEMLSMVGLLDHKDKFPDQLSGGMQRRLMLSMALIAGRKVLVLDEAFNGIDAFTKADLVKAVDEHCRRNATTLILVSHDMAEVAALADRIAVIDQSGVLSEIELGQSVTGNPLFSSEVSNRASVLYDQLRRLLGDVE